MILTLNFTKSLSGIGLFQKISTHPPMDRTELGTENFQDFQERQQQFMQDS